MAILQIATILVTALTMATSLAHALELPGKKRLPREHYLAVQPIYYPGFTYAGAAEPIAIILLALLLGFTPPDTAAFWLTLTALAAAAATHLIYWLLTAPVNKIWLENTELQSGAKSFFASARNSPTTDWTELRDRWGNSHLYRAITAATAFVLIVVRVVIE